MHFKAFCVISEHYIVRLLLISKFLVLVHVYCKQLFQHLDKVLQINIIAGIISRLLHVL